MCSLFCNSLSFCHNGAISYDYLSIGDMSKQTETKNDHFTCNQIPSACPTKFPTLSLTPSKQNFQSIWCQGLFPLSFLHSTRITTHAHYTVVRPHRPTFTVDVVTFSVWSFLCPLLPRYLTIDTLKPLCKSKSAYFVVHVGGTSID